MPGVPEMEVFALYRSRVEAAVDFLRQNAPFVPEIIIQLGTGLGAFADRISGERTISYADIPGFPQSTVVSHKGNLIFGRYRNHRIAILQGRFHYYEGYSTPEVALPIRALALLGAKKLFITNAAGGLNPDFTPGSLMLIRDHLYLLGENPLRGPNIDTWGPRFPDLSEPYSPELISLARHVAAAGAITMPVTGVYVCISGPSLETPAETRWLRKCGADAVGMSSIPEVIVARHAGLDVLGISVIANVNDPDNFQPITLEEIIANANRATPQLEQILLALLEQLPHEGNKS